MSIAMMWRADVRNALPQEKVVPVWAGQLTAMF